MKAQDYPIEHFKFMSELAIGLASTPAQILEHRYNYESFGSWWFKCKFSGKVYRVVYDGRDDCISIEKKYGLVWKEVKTDSTGLSTSDAVMFILGSFKRV
jgi:hypothetical protein